MQSNLEMNYISSSMYELQSKYSPLPALSLNSNSHPLRFPMETDTSSHGGGGAFIQNKKKQKCEKTIK